MKQKRFKRVFFGRKNYARRFNKKKHPQNGSRINKNQSYEVDYEAKKMGVANDGVVNAINKKGPSRKEVEKEFDKKKA